ncbi:hypothetical protein BBP40_000600 [Aspergillus hancockii]|nr:hypothetical protein BBP40_000600 [Aspergillus hancockii]
MFKVGNTDTTKRFRDHEKCYPDHRILLFTDCRDAERAEKLVHAEWSQCRRKHKCENHPSKKGGIVAHNEWFECTRDEIKDSVNTWASFVDHAYREDGYIDSTRLAPFIRDSTNERRWQEWVHKELEHYRNPSSPDSRTTKSLKDSVITSESEPVSVRCTPDTSRPGTPEACSSPAPISPSPIQSVKESINRIPAVQSKAIPGEPTHAEDKKPTVFSIGMGIFTNMLPRIL